MSLYDLLHDLLHDVLHVFTSHTHRVTLRDTSGPEQGKILMPTLSSGLSGMMGLTEYIFECRR